MPNKAIAELSCKEQLADRYLSWSVSLAMTADSIESKQGKDVSTMRKMSEAAKLKALALLD